MTEQNDHTEQPISYAEATAPPPVSPPTAYPDVPPPAQPPARRTFGVPVLAGIGAGALLVGGLAGGIVGYAVHSDGPDFARGPGQQRFPQGGPGTGQLDGR